MDHTSQHNKPGEYYITAVSFGNHLRVYCDTYLEVAVQNLSAYGMLAVGKTVANSGIALWHILLVA